MEGIQIDHQLMYNCQQNEINIPTTVSLVVQHVWWLTGPCRRSGWYQMLCLPHKRVTFLYNKNSYMYEESEMIVQIMKMCVCTSRSLMSSFLFTVAYSGALSEADFSFTSQNKSAKQFEFMYTVHIPKTCKIVRTIQTFHVYPLCNHLFVSQYINTIPKTNGQEKHVNMS